MPKPNRNSYSGPRDFRPIILTSFLLKPMERLVDRFLRNQALASVPLHLSQHAYKAGKSLEMALHQLVVRVEKTLDQQETALGVFLDIEGAFNNASFDSMCAAVVRHRVDHTIVLCIKATLEGRLTAATLDRFSVRDAVSRGVLSPLLWCLVVDDLIARPGGNGIYIQGYADDICLLAMGKCPNLVSGLMPWALHTVET
jgi:Reverse transcriptase (RNA-dependent DNA polymerase).